MTELCNHGGYCMRTPGHAGAHSAWPGSRTLDWDQYRSSLERNQELLEALDFPTPDWADLLDDEQEAA